MGDGQARSDNEGRDTANAPQPMTEWVIVDFDAVVSLCS